MNSYLVWRGDAFIKKVAALGEKALEVVGNMVRDEARFSMLTPKHGRLPRQHGGKSGKRHANTPSAPGEAPAVQTGKLYDSLKVFKRAELKWIVLADDAKAKYLEFGTRRIKPRPFLRPALEKTKLRVIEKLKGAL